MGAYLSTTILPLQEQINALVVGLKREIKTRSEDIASERNGRMRTESNHAGSIFRLDQRIKRLESMAEIETNE